MLKDKSPDMRKQAVFALGQQRDPKNASLLNEALKDENADATASGVRPRSTS